MSSIRLSNQPERRLRWASSIGLPSRLTVIEPSPCSMRRIAPLVSYSGTSSGVFSLWTIERRGLTAACPLSSWSRIEGDNPGTSGMIVAFHLGYEPAQAFMGRLVVVVGDNAIDACLVIWRQTCHGHPIQSGPFLLDHGGAEDAHSSITPQSSARMSVWLASHGTRSPVTV